MGVSMHSNNHLGVSMMIMAHACVASPQMKFACDTHYPWQSEQDEILVGGRVKFVDGRDSSSGKARLGRWSSTMDQVARLEERYRKLPFRKRDDEAEMREHVDPNWQRVLPRW